MSLVDGGAKGATTRRIIAIVAGMKRRTAGRPRVEENRP